MGDQCAEVLPTVPPSSSYTMQLVAAIRAGTQGCIH
jgi:hypothetical protein